MEEWETLLRTLDKVKNTEADAPAYRNKLKIGGLCGRIDSASPQILKAMSDRILSSPGTPVYLHDLLGIELLFNENGKAKARLKVEKKVCQPFGFLSGGASLALAEFLTGCGSLALCAPNEIPFGIQMSANHLSPVPLGGEITATARLLQKSRRLHVWHVDIVDEKDRLVFSCRATNYIKQEKT